MISAAAERVVVIGLDGATYDVLRPLMQLGVLPNLEQLLRDSAWSNLQSVEPCVTPAAWSTFQTGADPLLHGIVDYRYFDHRQGSVLMNTTARLDRATIFDCLSAAGEQVVSLSLPMTWPVPPAVSGLVIGGIDSPSSNVTLRPYPEFAQRLAARGIDLRIDSIWHRRPRSFEELHDRVEHTMTSFRQQATAAQLADQSIDWRCMVVQFQALDSIQHRCWHLLGIDTATCAAPNAWTTEVHRAFRALDRAVGKLVELAHRRNATVFVVSDHGFGPFREKISVREVLRRRDLLAPATIGQRLQFRAVRNLWKARRWARKTLYGRATNSMRRPLGSLDSIDWRRTRAVALHGAMSGLLYLVTPERFGRGPVATSSQHRQALAETMAAFREAAHPETGEALFETIIDVASTTGADPLEHCLPDVIAIPSPGFHARVKADRRPKLVPADPDLTGTHRASGVLMISGSGVAPGHRCAAHLRDVAPTLLSMLGVAGGESMQGESLSEAWNLDLPITADERHAPAMSGWQAGMSVDDQALVEQRLRELGYID